jgi:hypothetical protein
METFFITKNDSSIKPKYKSIAFLSTKGKAIIKYEDNLSRFLNKYDIIVLRDIYPDLKLKIDMNGDILLRMDFDV